MSKFSNVIDNNVLHPKHPVISNNPNGVMPTNEKSSTNNYRNLSISSIFDLELGQQTEKSNEETKGVKVESLPDTKSIDSMDSAIESIKSSNTDNSRDNTVKEKWYSLTLQVLIPFMFAGLGTIGAGVILGGLEDDPVFTEIDALFILIPSIIGLKGNLDMCLASRMSTQANLGNMKKKTEILKMIAGNIGLVQVQAIVAATVVSMYAITVSAIMKDHIEFDHILFVICCSILTATVSCFILDFFLIGIIIGSYKLRMNPDNLATPLAASIGDVVSLTILSILARFLFGIYVNKSWILYAILGVYLLMLPLLITFVLKNKYTSKVLRHGWIPVLSAVFISGISGLIMDHAVKQFNGFTVFQPIVNGVGGNLVSVQASRISTMLHKSSIPGIFPPHTKQWVWPWTALFYGALSAYTARILILISIPGQFLFVTVADLIYNSGVITITPVFLCTYLIVTTLQVMLLLYIAHLMTHFLWKRKIDPDNSAIPYLTALGDMFGSLLLLAAFVFLRSIDMEYKKIV